MSPDQDPIIRAFQLKMNLVKFLESLFRELIVAAFEKDDSSVDKGFRLGMDRRNQKPLLGGVGIPDVPAKSTDSGFFGLGRFHCLVRQNGFPSTR